MRGVQVSTEVFAAIWGARRAGEDTENAILARLLNLPTPDSKPVPKQQGYSNKRYGVSVPQGFMLERTFKGEYYEASACDGAWYLENRGLTYPSLTAMSDAIGTGIENVWANWHYTDSAGVRHPASDLRDPATIVKRKR